MYNFRYTKILPVGSKSDVDYKLCVQDLQIDTRGDGPLYYESCPSKAYCKLFVTEDGKKMLEDNELLWKFFRHSLSTCTETHKLTVTPVVFKTNVVEHCKFEFKESAGQRSPTSPAVSGEGALNPYDIVPCLRLKLWPTFMRKKVLEMYCFSEDDGTPLPLFVVPTGNALSQSRDLEWRFSFAVLEIEIFKQLKAHQRRLYGLAKYVFKVIFEELEIIQSYHLKILFLRRLEDDDLSDARPLVFLKIFFRYVLNAVENQYIPHLFIEDCNIYPLHYHTDEKETEFRLKVENENFENVMTHKIKEIISHDTKTEIPEWGCWSERANQVLKSRQDGGISESWISGYLTRLLSVIAYCLRKSQTQNRLEYAVKNLVKLVQANSSDKYIERVIPFILSLLKEVHSIDLFSDFGTKITLSRDRASHVIHKAFYCYEKHDVDGVNKYLAEADHDEMHVDTVGVTVTKFHKGLDFPLDYVIKCNERNLNSNRFYLSLNIICLHMKIQLQVRKLDKLVNESKDQNDNSITLISDSTELTVDVNNDVICQSSEEVNEEIRQITGEITKMVAELKNVVDVASVREPYTGKLSYKHVGSLLLMGYKEQFSASSHDMWQQIKIVSNTVCGSSDFNEKDLATNFDLR